MDYDFYVAASHPRRADAARVRGEIQRLGYTVKSNWIDDAPINGPELVESGKLAGVLRNECQRDAKELLECKALAVITDGKPQLTQGGRHAEVGMAIASKMLVYLIGPREQIFHYHPLVEHFQLEADFYAYLHAARPRVRGCR